MRLCFDATRFGSGLSESLRFAAASKFPCLEFSFSRFDVGARSANKLSKAEIKYLSEISEEAKSSQIEISSLRLLFPLAPGKKNSEKQFQSMIEKLAAVAKELSCNKLIFYLAASREDESESKSSWLSEVEKSLSALSLSLKDEGLKLLLSIGTPEVYLGKSLRAWRPLEPLEWAELLAGVPELSLSFSPADCIWQGIDYLRILPTLAAAIEHVEAQDVEVNRQIIAETGIFGPLWWRYKTVGKGQLDWGQFVEALKLYQVDCPLSIQFRDEFSQDQEGLYESCQSGQRLLSPLLKY